MQIVYMMSVVGPTIIVVPHYFKMTNNLAKQDFDEQTPITRIGDWS